MRRNPEIRIQYARLLDKFFKQLFSLAQEQKQIADDQTYNSPEQIVEKIGAFKEAWSKRQAVLSFMQKTLELDFYQPVIDVNVVGWIKHAISAPIVISSTKEVADFTDSLTHELLHRLISDNQQKIRIRDILQSWFPDETILCRNHVIVHALLKKIYLEFLDEPERLAVNRARDKKAPDYMRAWGLVEEIGEAAIIEKFKQKYKD